MQPGTPRASWQREQRKNGWLRFKFEVLKAFVGKIGLDSPGPESGLVSLNAPGQTGLAHLGPCQSIRTISLAPRKKGLIKKCYKTNSTYLLPASEWSLISSGSQEGGEVRKLILTNTWSI